MLAVVVFGGFALINPHLKPTASLRPKQVGVVAALFCVVIAIASLLWHVAGISLF